jgi:four helix bundle protein
MGQVKRFEDFAAWQKARTLAQAAYQHSAGGKFARDFALRDQVRRAAVSVMSNIAEGYERAGDKEFMQFLAVAKGSCGELRSQLYVALDQGYISQQAFAILSEQASEVSRMIFGLMEYLRGSSLKGRKYK